MGLFSDITKSSTGKTLCYHTQSTKKYLDFIENFDYEKYEIINISETQYSWSVTYKIRE